MVYDQDLEARVRNLLPRNELISERKMFGSLAFMYQNNMVCGIMADGLLARIGPSFYEEALKNEYVSEMNLTGRIMKNIVLVSIDGLVEIEELKFWIDRCLDFAKTLPPKEKKQKPEGVKSQKKKTTKRTKKTKIL